MRVLGLGIGLAVLVGCGGASAGSGGGSDEARVALGEVVERPPAKDVMGVEWRGPMRWRAPAHWSEVDSSGRPFVVAEYLLPGHEEDRPAHCLMSSGQKAGTEAELERQLAREVKRVGVNSEQGKSLGDRIEVATRSLGDMEWATGAARGFLYDDGTLLAPREPPLVVADYAGRAAAPRIAGPPFAVRCVAPVETLDGEAGAIDAWLASVEVDPLTSEAG